MAPRALLLYEGDCGFCNRCARFIARRMPTTAELRPWQRTNLAAYGISQAQVEYEVVWVGADGRRAGGAQAIARLLVDCGGPWAVLGHTLRVPPVRWLAHAVYRLVANNRSRLPGGGPSCGLRPRRDDAAGADPGAGAA